MSKNKISDYDATEANNTEVEGVGIIGSSPPSNFDNALRQIMAHLADMNAGTSPIDDTFTLADPADLTKRVRIDAGSVAAGQTRVIGMPNKDVDLGDMVAVETVTDWNTVTKSGNYTGDDITNNPNSVSGLTGPFTATALMSSDGLYGFIQGAYLEESTITIFRKLVNDGSYGAWILVADVLLDEDDLASDSATKAATQQSIKAYIDALSKAPDAVLEDQKASGTAGGTFTSGAWQKRTLNTEVYDPNGLISITSDEFTPTVSGWVEWRAPAYQVNAHQTRLYNVTDSAVVTLGTSEYVAAAETVVGSSTGSGGVVAGKTYRIEHQALTTKATFGFGVGTAWGTEVYSRVTFWRA